MRTTTRRLLAGAGIVATGLLVAACGGGATPAKAVPKQEAAAAHTLVIHADTVLGTKNLTDDQKATSGCVLESRYARNSQVVWRARVLDGTTGTQLDDTQLVSVVAKLSDGQTFPLKYAPHPKATPTDAFWATSWTIPADYPTGSVDYTITATSKDGATTTFQPFNVAPSLLTITKDVLPAAAPAS